MRWVFDSVKRWRLGGLGARRGRSRWRSPAGPARSTTGPATDVGVPAGTRRSRRPDAGHRHPRHRPDLTGLGAVASDYLFRGISQTRNNWAVQGTFDLEHESGVYVGAFLTNAKFLASPTTTPARNSTSSPATASRSRA
jgi:hypothetical protein